MKNPIKDEILDRPLFSLTTREFLELQEFQRSNLSPLQPIEGDPQKELLTIHEAAEFLHLSVATLYTMNSRRRIVFTKVSGKVYYRRSALMLWLDSGERKTTAQLCQEGREGK